MQFLLREHWMLRVETRFRFSWAFFLLITFVFQCLNNIAKCRERFIDIFSFCYSFQIFLCSYLFTSSQINKSKLTKRYLRGKFDLFHVLLTIFTWCIWRLKILKFKIFFRIQFNLKDCMASGTCHVLSCLKNLSFIKSIF